MRSSRVLFTSSKGFEEEAFRAAPRASDVEFVFSDVKLSSETAAVAKGFDAVCVFVSDRID